MHQPRATPNPRVPPAQVLAGSTPAYYTHWVSRAFTRATHTPTIDVWDVSNDPALHPGGVDCLHICHATGVFHVWSARLRRSYIAWKDSSE